MAEVAKQDQYVEDVHGIRRLVKAGDVVPVGLFGPDAIKADTVDTRSLGKAVVDEDASKPSGTAADPLGGISFDRAAELQKNARGSKSGRSAQSKD